MTNRCYFSMRVVGKEKNVKEFSAMLHNNHPDKICFAKVLNCRESSRITIHEDNETEDTVKVDFTGSCAWSVYSCMMSGDCAYNTEGGRLSNGLSDLETESKILNLAIEVWSDEPVVGFQEHYIIKNGVMETSECKNVIIIDDDLLKEEGLLKEQAEKKYGVSISDDLYYSDFPWFVEGGGFENYEDFSI